MRRELREVKTEAVLGSVGDTEPRFEGVAGDFLGGLRRMLGDDGAIRDVLAHGWSNGYYYFAEPTP